MPAEKPKPKALDLMGLAALETGLPRYDPETAAHFLAGAVYLRKELGYEFDVARRQSPIRDEVVEEKDK